MAQQTSALLAQIAHEQAIWEQLIAEIGEEQMLEPNATGEWTFKDVVAHLNGWRILSLARLDAAQHGRTPAAPPWPAEFGVEDELDAINDWIYTANRDRPLRVILDEYGRSFQQMADAVKNLSERDLSETGRYQWLEGYPLADVITNSFGHFHEEHEPQLRAWLDQRKRA